LSGWLLKFPSHEVSRLESKNGTDIHEELWQEWEWVLTRTEELSQKQSKEEANLIKQELRNLRQTANALKWRPLFNISATELISILSVKEKRDLGSVLLSSESSKIISDVINQFADIWLKFIHQTFFQGEESIKWIAFSGSYKERPYEKNIIGALKELTFSACHGPVGIGVNQKVLSDIMWSLWKTLSTTIRTGIDRELTNGELALIATEVVKTQNSFVNLWIQTVRNTRLGKTKEGILIKKWAKENEEEQKKLLKVKSKGVDAKYEYKPYNPSMLTTKREKELKELKKILETKLSPIFES